MRGRLAVAVALAAAGGVASCNAIVGFSDLSKVDHCVKDCDG